jgi:hypothetical protein
MSGLLSKEIDFLGKFKMRRLNVRHGFPTSHCSLLLKVSVVMPRRAHNDPNLLSMINCMDYLGLIREFLRLK